MPKYKYLAINEIGKKISGTYTTDNRNELIKMLRDNKYHPIEIKEVVEGKDINFGFKKVKTKDIAIFARQFYTMLNSGLSLVNCIGILRVQTENKVLKKTLNLVYDDLQKGMTFSDSLNKYKDVFPELLINMVEAGEISGNLDTIMNRMANHYERENKVMNKVKGAMVYPVILSVISLVIIIFLLVFVMPTFVSMFESSGVSLPLPTRILLNISNNIKTYWYMILLSVLLLIYFIKRLSLNNRFRYYIDDFKFKIPIINMNTKKIITSRFTRTLSTLLYSGVPLMKSLEIVAKIVGNKVVEEGILNTKEELRKGIDLATPLESINIFSPMVISMIKIGEESGALDEILEKTADFYDEEVETSLKKLTTLLEPLMIVVMAIVIAVIIIAMVLPMFDMLNTINY